MEACALAAEALLIILLGKYLQEPSCDHHRGKNAAWQSKLKFSLLKDNVRVGVARSN